LKRAKSFGDILIVGINSDNSVRKLKGKYRPVVNEKERAEIVSSLKWVDYVTIFKENNPIKLISKIKPEIHVKGGDYTSKKLIEEETVTDYGGIVKIVPHIKTKSTTNIITKIIQSHER